MASTPYGAHLQYLWGDVVRCPDSRGAVDQSFLVHLEAGAEVCQLDVTVLVNEDIVWLDVTERERGREGEREGGREGGREE